MAPTSDANAGTSPESSVDRQPIGPGIEDIGILPSGPSHQGNKGVGHSSAGIHEDGSVGTLSYHDKLLWRRKYCLLLNEDFSVHGRAFIQVYLPDKPFNDDILGDIDVGVM